MCMVPRVRCDDTSVKHDTTRALYIAPSLNNGLACPDNGRALAGDLILAAAGVKEGHDLNKKNADPATAEELLDGTPRGDLRLLANAIQFNPGFQMRPAEYHMPCPGGTGGVLLSEPLPLWERHSTNPGETLAERIARKRGNKGTTFYASHQERFFERYVDP